MGAIIPAILPTSREDLEVKLTLLQGVSNEVQVDVVDGRFATPATWPYADCDASREADTAHAVETALADGAPPVLENFRFEVDLMVEDPMAQIGHWIRVGASRITVHAETARNLSQVIEAFTETYGRDKDFAPDLLALGIALNVSTEIDPLEETIAECDYVQFMGIAQIGKQGEPFDPRVLQKIHDFHTKHPDMPIQVDGGVSLETAPDLLRAGASRLVVGSGLWRAPDLKLEYGKFDELTQVHGIYS
jgi:pentose-5-phosphate-3-epimerase